MYKSGSSRETGQLGEAIALGFLRNAGHKILAVNMRNKLGEIDIITEFKKRIHFIEVKWRRTGFCLGRESVTSSKQKKIRNVATAWLIDNGLYTKRDTCFDVIEIDGHIPNHRIEHFENCF
ncbi:MAG: YraN family protein [Firmicutes bacterium]|nr:YraN family protein [Bacillota bacterium]